MHISTHLDPSRLADLARDPNHCKAEAAHQALRTAQAAHPRFAATSCSQCGTDTGPGNSGFSHCADHRARDAERAVFRAAAQAIDASQRPCFDREAGVYPGLCGDLRAEVDAEGGFTSLQPLGDAQVMVVYSSDGTDLSIDGATINGEFVHIDCFTSVVRGQWYRAIKAEERKDAEIASWGE